jgi:Domain of unknown function (DUF5664)
MADESIKGEGINPKDLLGVAKVSITKLPAVGILHGAHAMMNGAEKYGPYNWREKPVIASIYVDAMMRHILAWFDEREECAADSGVKHLGHVIASASIILDAQATGNLGDDRPGQGKGAAVMDSINAVIKQRREAKNGKSGS